MVSVQTAIARQKQGMQSVGAQRLKEGYDGMTDHPGVKAAQRVDAYVNGVNRARGKWAKNVAGKHTLSELKQRMATKGVSNYNSSIATANDSYAKNAPVYIQQAQTIAASLPPRGDIGANLARAQQQAQKMHDFAVQQIGA